MTTYNTGNPIGSTEAKDLFDNAQNFDRLVNDRSTPSYPDRLGVARRTWWGMEQDFNAFLQSTQFEMPPLVYAAGLQILRSTQVVDRAGQLYRVLLPASFPVTLTGVWATDQTVLTPLSDSSLRQDLAAATGTDLISFQQSGVSAAVRSVTSRMRDWVSVKDFGAVGDGTTNDTAAVQAAIAAHSNIFFPPGTYRLQAGLTSSNKALRLYGSGKSATILRWDTAVTNAIAVTNSAGLGASSRFPFQINDMTLSAGVAAAGTAISLDYTIGAGGFVYTGINSLVLENVDIRGDDYFGAATKYWTRGLYLKNTGSVVMSKLNMLGKQNIAGTKAVQIEATNGPNTSFFVKDFTSTWWETGVDIYNNTGNTYTIEGLYFTDFEIVGSNRGVFVRGGPVHALRMANGHINGETAAVQYDASARGSTAFGLSNSYVQIANLYSGTYKTGSVLSLDVVHYSQIHDNYISGKPAPFTIAQNGIACLSSNRCTIDGNTLVDLNGTGILVGNNGVTGECVGTVVGETNAYQNVNTSVTVSGNANGLGAAARANSGFASMPTGPRAIWGTTAITLDASGNGTITLPNGGFPNNYFSAVVCSGDPAIATNASFNLVHASCTKTTLAVAVRPNPGAIGVRFQYMAWGD